MNRPLPDPRNNSMLLYCTICGMVCDHIIRDHIVHSHKEYFRALPGRGEGTSFKKENYIIWKFRANLNNSEMLPESVFSSQTLEKKNFRSDFCPRKK